MIISRRLSYISLWVYNPHDNSNMYENVSLRGRRIHPPENMKQYNVNFLSERNCL